jgi:hypothetical protein
MRARARSAPLLVLALGFATTSVVVMLAVPDSGSAGTASTHRPPALGTIVLPALGFGYAVTSQGPLDASQFPTGSPSASAAAGALSALGHTIETYQRTWQDGTGANQVQDLVVAFPTDAGARAFIGAARRALERGEIVSSGPLSSVPGAQRATYFGSSNPPEVEQTITVRAGDYAAVLSFVSAASGNPAPITRASAARVARAQYAAMVAAVTDQGTAKSTRGGASSGRPGWAVLAVAVVVLVVATALVLRRRFGRNA